jgi:hypothetical protein
MRPSAGLAAMYMRLPGRIKRERAQSAGRGRFATVRRAKVAAALDRTTPILGLGAMAGRRPLEHSAVLLNHRMLVSF